MFDFLKELTRRKVWLFGGIYLALGWVLLQVAALLESTLKLPDWIDQSALVLLVIGFPVALLLAWAQESQGTGDAGEGKAASVSDALRRDCSVAVLPFNDLSRDGEFADVADGIPEDILTQLAPRTLLDVAARNSSFAFKGTSPDIRQVGDALGVRFVFEGSIRRAADHVRVTGQLVETLTGSHVWARSFNLPSDNWASEVEATVERLSGGIFIAIHDAEKRRLLSGSLEALTVSQLTAFATFNIASASAKELTDSKKWVELALKKSPDDGEANAAMGRIKALLPAAGEGDREALWKEADAYLGKAKESGPPSFEAMISIAGAQAAMGRYAELETCARQMCDHSPNHGAGWAFAAMADIGAGRWQDLATTTQRGLSLVAPQSPNRAGFYRREAIANFMLDDFEAAEQSARNFLLLRDEPMSRYVLVAALVSSGRLDEAKRELVILLQSDPDHTLASFDVSAAGQAMHPDLKERLLDSLAAAGLEEGSVADD